MEALEAPTKEKAVRIVVAVLKAANNRKSYVPETRLILKMVPGDNILKTRVPVITCIPLRSK